MPILQSLEKIDRSLFELINHDATAPFLDPVMSLLRNPDTWIPLYVFMAFWSVIRLKKVTWLFVLCTLITFAFTDSVTAFIFKPLFERLRPCAEPALAGIVRVLDGCGGKYSFPSNHASNHFGLAAFWFGAIHLMTGKRWYWLWIWAFLVCYAQVYVGKHYPGDILAGAIFGICTGILTYRLFLWLQRFIQKKLPETIAAENNPGTEVS
jgi:membrane-associated phospholipid phosphatase